MTDIPADRDLLQLDLRDLEAAFGLSSAAFYARWQAGDMPDTHAFNGWAALYEAWLSLPQEP